MELYMILAIIAGFFFALRHIVNKYVLANRMCGIAWFYFYTSISIVSFPIISWSISAIILPTTQTWFFIITSSIVAFIGVLIFIYALTLGDVTTAMPVVSSRPIFIVPLSFIFLNEFYGYQVIGWILLIVFGAILTSWDERTKPRHMYRNKALGLFFATTILWSIMSILSKPALQEIGIFNFLGWSNIVQAPLLLAFIPFVLHKAEKIDLKKHWRPTLPYAILENVFLYGSVIAFFYGLKFSVTLTEALIATSGAFTVMMGYIMSRINPNLIAEKHTKGIYLLRLIGTIIIIIGVYQILA